MYKEDFDKLFDPILPIEEERVHIVQHGDTLQIAEDRILTFYDTPGHAKHHISIHDSLTNGILLAIQLEFIIENSQTLV